MNLLHIDAAITGTGSVTRQISAAIVDAALKDNPAINVIHRDLDAEPVPHLDSASIAKLGGGANPSADDAEATRNLALVEEFLAADIVVIGAPMYNFSVSSQLKAWIDRIAVAGKTFRYGENGAIGLAGGKKVFVASARGGIYSGPAAAADFQEPFLRQVFAFLGVEDVVFVRAEGVAYGPDHRKVALETAIADAARAFPVAEAA